MSMFSKPASSTGIKWDELKGSLLIIEPTGVEVGIKTQYGDADAVKATVTVVDGDQAGTAYVDTLIFPKLLQNAVKDKVGGMVLGRLGQGNKKPGQSAPWVLADFTDADVKAAEAVIEARGPQATVATEKIPF